MFFVKPYLVASSWLIKVDKSLGLGLGLFLGTGTVGVWNSTIVGFTLASTTGSTIDWDSFGFTIGTDNSKFVLLNSDISWKNDEWAEKQWICNATM